MGTLEEIIGRFKDEAQDIYNYVDYVETLFHSGCNFCCDILSDEKHNEIEQILKNLKWNTEDTNDQNQAIINRIKEIIDQSLIDYDVLLETNLIKDIPEELEKWRV